jgi:hypothetical protein
MRFMVPALLVAIVSPQLAAQEEWQQLPGAAEAYAVDLHSISRDRGVLSARIRTRDVGSGIIVQQVQVRCASSQLRTIGEELYDGGTGRPLHQPDEGRREVGSVWPEYEVGSEGHALVSGLCALARKRNVQGPA